MSYGDFSDVLFIKTINTSESPMIGAFRLVNSKELESIIVHFYINDQMPVNETAKLEIHAEETGNSLLFSSDTVNLSQIENVSANVIATVKFTFDRPPLSQYYYYYPKLVLGNYTRASTEKYIGMVKDWPIQTNTFSIPYLTNYPTKYEVYGYKI